MTSRYLKTSEDALAISQNARKRTQVLTLTFALFGFLSPANRGSLITALLMLYARARATFRGARRVRL